MALSGCNRKKRLIFQLVTLGPMHCLELKFDFFVNLNVLLYDTLGHHYHHLNLLHRHLKTTFIVYAWYFLDLQNYRQFLGVCLRLFLKSALYELVFILVGIVVVSHQSHLLKGSLPKTLAH